MLEAAKQSTSIKKIVLMSSIAATGPSTDGKPLNESSDKKPITNYGKSKLIVEELAEKYYSDFKLPIVVIKPPMVYGIGDTDWIKFFEMIKTASVENKKLFLPGNHKNTFDFCNVDNLVTGMIQAEKEKSTCGNIYFLSDERAYKIDEIIQAVCNAYGVEKPKKYFSKKFAYSIAYIMDFFSKLFRFDPPISSRDVNWMTMNYWICSCEKAKKDFLYSPVISLNDGIKSTLEWYEKQEV